MCRFGTLLVRLLSGIATGEPMNQPAQAPQFDERKVRLVEQASQQNEAKLRAILETAAEGIITINKQGIIESINPAALRMFGYVAADVIGQNVNMLMPSPYREEHDGYIAEYLETGQKKIIGLGREVAGQRKDGSTFPLHLAVGEMWLGDQWYFTGIIHDISETRQARRALAYSEAKMRAVLETAVEGIVVIDKAGTIESINPAVERMFGYSAQEVVGQNVKLLMPSPYRAEHDGYLSDYLRTGERRIIGIGREVVGQRKDGSTFPMYLSVAEMQLDGEPHFTGMVRDLTDAKQCRTAVQKERLAAIGQMVTGYPTKAATICSAYLRRSKCWQSRSKTIRMQ